MRRVLWNPSVADFLRSIGAGANLIAFIEAQSDTKVQGKLANEVRKRPSITVAELADIATHLPQKRELNTEERDVVRGIVQYRFESNVKEWLEVQLMKYRVKKFSDGRYAYSMRMMVNEYHADPNIGEMFSLDHETLPLLEQYAGEIGDWAFATRARLASYSWEEAVIASNEWHEQVAAVAAGRAYDPQDPKLIVYQFKDGWKLVEVVSKNDLEVEGNLMHHCVGSYYELVKGEKTSIMSLRDPKNKPHVTIEVDKGWIVNQVKGFANSEPKPDIAKRLEAAFAAMLENFVPLRRGAKFGTLVDYKRYGLALRLGKEWVDVWFNQWWSMMLGKESIEWRKLYFDVRDKAKLAFSSDWWHPEIVAKRRRGERITLSDLRYEFKDEISCFWDIEVERSMIKKNDPRDDLEYIAAALFNDYVEEAERHGVKISG